MSPDEKSPKLPCEVKTGKKKKIIYEKCGKKTQQQQTTTLASTQNVHELTSQLTEYKQCSCTWEDAITKKKRQKNIQTKLCM